MLLIFYSQKCKHSSEILKIMQDNKLLNMFKMECIDGYTPEKITTIGIQYIPTIVILEKGCPPKIYEENKAFDFVQNLIKSRLSNLANPNKKVIKNIMNTYNVNETTGISDTYSFWANDININTDFAQPKSFCGIAQQPSILTVKEQSKDKVDKQKQESLIKHAENIRNKQIADAKQIYEQQQLLKVQRS
jgi:hypothetical protein